MEIFLASTLGALVLGGALAARPLKRWIKKCRRRRGGVYLWRVDHHRNRARRVNGYVGETVSYYFRGKDQMGQGRKGQEAPWSDLNPKRYQVIPLPWWLCWKWVLRPLETLVILCTWPVYNDAKNRWNPRRIPKDLAAAQREAREYGRGVAYTTRVTLAHGARIALQVAGAATVLIGTYGWIVTR